MWAWSSPGRFLYRPPGPFIDAKYGCFAVCSASTPALDPASPEIAFVDSHNPEEGSVSLAGPVDPLAQSSVDAVDGVAVKPGEFGRLQGGQISGKVSNNLPKLAF